MAVPMRSPQGDLHWIRASEVSTAQNAGGKVDFNGVPQPAKEGFLGALPHVAGNLFSGAVNSLKGAIEDVGATSVPGVNTMGGGAPQHGQQAADAMKQQYSPAAQQQRKAAGYNAAYRAVAPAAAAATGVNLPAMEEAAGNGDTGAVLANAVVPAVAAAAAPAVAKAVPAAVGAVGDAADAATNLGRGALADRMNVVPPGEQFSRAAVLQDAQDHGVNLDLAQATESPVLAQLKNANRYSIASQGIYDRAQTANLNALEQWADQEASRYSPNPTGGREVVGPQMQAALKAHLEARKNLASTMFSQLDDELGGVPQDVSTTVQAAAQKILDENKGYYADHPELKPTKAWAIIQDLAKQPTVTKEIPGTATGTAPGLVDVNGNTAAVGTAATQTVAVPKTATWSDLHQLRSDLMDFYRNNPDVVKGRSEAWIQQMVASIDNSMTGAESRMTPQQLADFRQANGVWESIKNTYDNPQSPYYSAIRNQQPSQVPGTLSKGTPELARSVRDVLSSLDDSGSMEGTFQRQFIETQLNGKDGETLDLAGLNQRLKAIPQDRLNAMLGEEGAARLRMLGKVAQKITGNANPSGTARVGVPASEMGRAADIGAGVLAAHPATSAAGLGYFGAQYSGAKLLNSQWLLDHLTTPK